MFSKVLLYLYHTKFNDLIHDFNSLIFYKNYIYKIIKIYFIRNEFSTSFTTVCNCSKYPQKKYRKFQKTTIYNIICLINVLLKNLIETL